MRREVTSRFRAAVALVATTLWVGAAGMATPAAEPASPLHEAMGKNMLKMRAQIKNARMKLGHGIQGISGSTTRDVPSTPARSCCGSNLERISQAAAELEAAFEELDACYQRTAMSDALTDLQFVKSDLRVVVEAKDAFAHATAGEQVSGAMGGMMRAYNLLAEGFDALPRCESRGAGKKTKAKKKKKTKSEDQ